ncbi:hypothetical protein HK104_009460, partial [Borealophlyctis nickersoniae]
MGCIKALEPAWRAWTSAAEGNISEAVKKDMALTMAYDCLFGVAGRIDVLRQPTFTSFLLSVAGSAGFDMGIRAMEAVHFADWQMKSRISLHVPNDAVREVFNSAQRMEMGQSLVKHPSELDLGIAEKPLKQDIIPRIMSVLPKRMDVEPLGAAEEGKVDMPLAQIHSSPLHCCTNGDPIVLIEKPRTVVPVQTPKAATQPTSANIMSVSVFGERIDLRRLRNGANNLKILNTPVNFAQADAIFRLQSFFVMAFFISLAPESRHACFGYVDYVELSKRVAVSTAVAIVAHLVGLGMEERLTPVRYQRGERDRCLPSMLDCLGKTTVSKIAEGGRSGMLAVDAGLFGETGCRKKLLKAGLLDVTKGQD